MLYFLPGVEQVIMKSESPTDMEALDVSGHLPCLFGTDQR